MTAASSTPPSRPSRQAMLEREAIANRKKHWVRAVTACNSRCLFCLDADTPRNVFIPTDEVKAELRRGREELGADKVIISGGEATLHPDFVELVRYARQELGYDRVQTVTNGTMFADRGFYVACRDAGLGEITFSLHGHTPELHDWLTQTPGGFHKLMKGMIRARRDPRGPIVNVDICINRQNVAVIDRIVELCLSVGVTEFDLLHVIPQANAFENRDLLFYDVREHLPRLQKVFRLNRHPGVTVWTNRFPVHYLEGLEDLIQDPHKMLDEVNGRRFMVRNYLDVGKPMECRDPERCRHCFIEPFCTTMDRRVASMNHGQEQVWVLGSAPVADLPVPLPYGCDTVGIEVPDPDALVRRVGELPAGLAVEARVATPGPVPAVGRRLRLCADTAAQLDAWLGGDWLSEGELDIDLNRDTGPWLLQHRDRLVPWLDRIRIHQPSWEHMADAAAHDVRDPAAFFTALGLPVQVSGLAACQAPGTVLVEERRRIGRAMFDPDTGRLAIGALARDHVARAYRAKSVRCDDCRVRARCEGIHINMLRDQGLRLCRPLVAGKWADEAAARLEARWPEPPARVADGKPLEPPHDSLPGYAPPAGPVADPLAVTANALGRRPRPLVRGPTRIKGGPPRR
ncbi:MAG: radical SAM protein [Deltaproteobacteria bacterium]|nr:MAG: radical SAM protein [Deltaproteobacteria bacterium]